jgi:hypothetical protein
MQPLEIVGIGSALLVLAAFVLNEYGELSSESIWYDGINLVASLGLFIYASVNHVWPFVLTNGVWALVSGIDVVRYLVKGSGERKRRRRHN